jgi:hypothetical protein
MRRSAPPLAVMLAAGLAGVAGCAGEPAEEPTDEAVSVERSAFSIASCAEANPNFNMTHPWSTGWPNDVTHTSPATYNTCYKGYVVDVFHNEASLGLPEDGWRKQVTVTWGGPIPLTQAGCENLEGSAILYDYDDFGPPDWILPQQQRAVGRWVRVDNQFWTCSIPRMTFTAYPAFKTRVAATMRYISGSNPTASVKIAVKSIVQ